MSAELLPCPFCGGKAMVHGPWTNWTNTDAVICTKCGAVVTKWDNESAETRWNRRSED